MNQEEIFTLAKLLLQTERHDNYHTHYENYQKSNDKSGIIRITTFLIIKH